MYSRMDINIDFNEAMSIALPVGVFVLFVCCACYGIHRKRKRSKRRPRTKVQPEIPGDFV